MFIKSEEKGREKRSDKILAIHPGGGGARDDLSSRERSTWVRGTINTSLSHPRPVNDTRTLSNDSVIRLGEASMIL